MTERITSDLRDSFWNTLPELGLVPDPVREPLVGRWLRAGQMEHASVASFARFSLQLLTFGAPAQLVEQAHRAALDEIEHARMCFALASAYAGKCLGPTELDGVTAGCSNDFGDVLCTNVAEGCVAETLAALEVTEAARRAIDPTIATCLQAIAADEHRHAQLAWQFWGWAVGQRPELRAASETAFELAIEGALKRAVGEPLETELTSFDLEPHGHLAQSTQRTLIARNVRNVLEPAKARVLGTSA